MLRGGRVRSSEMVLDLLTVKQSVVVLEMMMGLGNRYRIVDGGFGVAQTRRFVEGELECQDVGRLVSKQIGGGDNQWHLLEG
jgi:hypothetical protein